MSFVYLGVGFWFYIKKFPENSLRSLRQRCGAGPFTRRLVQVFLASHFWWHFFVVMNGYTLYWLCYDFCKHVELFDGHGLYEPGAPLQHDQEV